MQRVPDSEKSGRRHSSTIIVSRITQVKTDVIINKSDVRVDTYRASGNGGQHRNKTDSAIRLTHLSYRNHGDSHRGSLSGDKSQGRMGEA